MPKKHREIFTLKGERKTSVSNGEKKTHFERNIGVK
jgi:hypothetical protein